MQSIKRKGVWFLVKMVLNLSKAEKPCSNWDEAELQKFCH